MRTCKRKKERIERRTKYGGVSRRVRPGRGERKKGPQDVNGMAMDESGYETMKSTDGIR